MFPPIIVYVFTCLFFVFGRFIDEYCKQHGKYHCLNEAEQKTKYVHDYRQSYREQFKQRFRRKLFAVDIAVKSQCHGNRTRKLLEDQDREQERKWLEERAEVFAKAMLFMPDDWMATKDMVDSAAVTVSTEVGTVNRSPDPGISPE